MLQFFPGDAGGTFGGVLRFYEAYLWVLLKKTETLRQGHVNGLNVVLRSIQYRHETEPPVELVRRIEQTIVGEMVLCRENLESLCGDALARLQSEYRNGILRCDRRIAALEAAIGDDQA